MLFLNLAGFLPILFWLAVLILLYWLSLRVVWRLSVMLTQEAGPKDLFARYRAHVGIKTERIPQPLVPLSLIEELNNQLNDSPAATGLTGDELEMVWGRYTMLTQEIETAHSFLGSLLLCYRCLSIWLAAIAASAFTSIAWLLLTNPLPERILLALVVHGAMTLAISAGAIRFEE